MIDQPADGGALPSEFRLQLAAPSGGPTTSAAIANAAETCAASVGRKALCVGAECGYTHDILALGAVS